MNATKSKRIRRHSKKLLVSWLKSLLDSEEAEKITEENYEQLMPEQTHVYGGGKLRLNAYHPKWLSKKIKQLIKIFPEKEIEDIDLELVAWKAQKSQA